MTHPPSARLVTETALADALDAATEALNLGTASTHPASDFDPAGAASSAQAAATAAAASDATTKASAAQAAAISAAASDATTKASAAQSAATSAAATDATTKANAVAAQLPNYARLVKVSDLTYPLVIGHRGAANMAPENSMASYLAAQAMGVPAIEAGDVQATADGALVCMHDNTIDRTSSGSGAVSAMTSVGIQRNVLDSSAWFGAGAVDVPIPLWTDVLDRLGGRSVLVPEVKDGLDTTAVAMAKAVQALGLTNSVIFASFTLSNLVAVQPYGIATMYIVFDPTGVPSAAAITAAGVGMVGVGYVSGTSYSALVARLHAAGIKLIGYTVDRQWLWDEMIAAGFDGGFTNDPLYAPRVYKYRSTTTTWAKDGTFGHGMSAGPGAPAGPLVWSQRAAQSAFRGSAGAWRWPLSNSVFYIPGGVLPIAAAAGSYTATVNFAVDTVPGSTSLGVSAYVCLPNDSVTVNGSSNAYPAYLFKARVSGLCQAWIAASGGTTSQGTITGTQFSAPVLSSGLTAGVAITSLPVTALTVAVKSGHMFYMPDGTYVTVSANTAIGATAIPIASYTPAVAVATSTVLVPRVQLKFVVTPTTVTVSRGDEPTAGSIVITDASTRGGYLYLSHDLTNVSVESVAIT